MLEFRVEETTAVCNDNAKLIDETRERREGFGLDRDIVYEQKELDDQYKIFEKDKQSIIAKKQAKINKTLRSNDKKADKMMKKLIYNDQNLHELKTMMNEIHDHMDCPVLLTTLENPCLSSSGHVYEYNAIENSLENGGKDPITRQDFQENVIRPHYLCGSIINILNRYQVLVASKNASN